MSGLVSSAHMYGCDCVDSSLCPCEHYNLLASVWRRENTADAFKQPHCSSAVICPQQPSVQQTPGGERFLRFVDTEHTSLLLCINAPSAPSP